MNDVLPLGGSTDTGLNRGWTQVPPWNRGVKAVDGMGVS